MLFLLVSLPLGGRARAEDIGRGALSVGVASLGKTAPDISNLGFHVGWESSYHFGPIGPMISLSFDRFAGLPESAPPRLLFTMGAGFRAFAMPTRHPFALFLDLQGLVLGADNPIGNAGSSWVGFGTGAGIEWARGLSFALAGRYHHLADGPKMVTASLVVGLGAP